MKRKTITKHHLFPKSLGGRNDADNISFVNAKAHEAWHTLFWNLNVYQIACEINKHWIPKEYEFVVRRKLPPTAEFFKTR